ncbi:COL6A [Mytilus edulis]|uniref:COL6A n=1 Tax=Mytilus edulis TaxID=6550 RepID=A0A8S3PS02_MYTED|nr:COL6A [Mytilus edulis]
MFRPDQGDRDYARNFILLITGQDKSLSTNDAWRAAERAETDGIQLYVMGLNINDREELDETSSHPLSTYQYLTRSERELAEVPPQIYADLLGMAKNPPPMRPRPVKPDVDIKPYRSTVRYGGPLTIECTVTSGIPVKEVTWYRVQGDSRTPVVVDGRKYSGSTVRVPSLTINNADFQDEGTYVCTAENAAGVGSSPNGDIDVTGALFPGVTVPKREYTGDLGTEVTLECDVVANPPETTVYWRKEERGEMVDVDTRSSRFSRASPSSPSLTIRNLDTSDTGIYQCFADNPVGTGQSQQTSLRVLSCGQAQVDIVIILDSSTSVGDDNYQKMKDFCKDFLKNADLDSGNIRAGIVSYSTGVHIEFQLNDYSTSQDIMDAIDAIPYRYGSTNTADGLRTMRSQMFTSRNGDRDGVPNVVIILTDGVSNINSRRTIPEAEQARAAGIHIYAVGIGLRDTRELDAMASEPASENSFNVQSFDELAVLSDQVFKLSVQVSFATTLKPQETGYDLVVILDSSVSQEYFDWMTTFTKNLADTVSIDDDEFRVGLLRYSTDSNVQFNLKDYQSSGDVQNAVDQVGYKGGITNTAQAIDTARTQMFRPDQGDRDYARNFILLITGQDKSLSTNDAWRAAERAETDGIQLYVMGLNINDREELDETSSHPLSTYQYLTRSERELAEVPPQIYADLLGMAKNPPPMRPRPVKPDVDIKPYRSTVRYGGPLTIECTVNSGIPVKEVTWYRVQGDSRTPVVVDGRKYSGSTVRVPSLTINNADFQDEGTYVCTAENAAGVGSSPNGDIDVTGALPTVTVPKREYTGDLGTDVTLECDVVANPPETTVYWRREDRGEMVDVDTRSSRYSRASPSSPSLTIRNLDTSDTGMYQCFADNPVGTGQSQQTSLRVLLPITLPTTDKPCGQAQVDIVIILDSSTSVGDDNYQKMKDFCKDFLKNADLDSGNIRAGIVSYSTGVHIEFQLNDYSTSQDIMDAIDAIPYRYGSTNTADGLRTMRSQMFTSRNGDRDGVPNVVIILTDGVSNINSRRTIPEAEQARAAGIHIYAVGIGLRDTRELDAMASEPASENSFNVQSFDELAVLSDQVFQAFCPVATTLKPQETGYDLVVILDSSVSQEYFDWMTTFTKNLADTVSIDDDEFRVGLLRYSTDSNVQFNLKDYQSSGDVQNAVDQVGYKGGITNTAQAIETARTQMFRPDQGDRDYARNFILLITGQDKSLSTNDAWRAAERAETDGIQLYVMGLNINDREELDETSSHPLKTYQYLTRSERELAEVPPQIYADLLGMAKNPPPMRPRPVKPDVDIKPYRSTVRYGGPVTIECTVKSGIPVKEVTWYRVQGDSRTPVVVDGRKYSGSTVRVPSLTINNADFQDEGTYVCTAENAAGVGSSPNGDIDVTGEVTLECDVVANPPESTVYWRREDRGEMVDVDTSSSRYSRASPSSPSLTIRNLDTSDTGMYQCFADNPVGTGQSQQTSLRVLLPITLPTTDKPCGQAQVDIVIILDSSTSVGDDNYQKMKDFCKDFLKNADLDSGNIRAGIVSYSTGVHIEFQMNDYSTSQDIMDAIDAIPYRYGSTNTADGLRTMRSQMFTSRNGDRDGVPNVVIILTDGVSNINSRRTIPEAEQARAAGIHIYAVGIGLRDTRELDAMASEPASENSFNVQSFDELAVLSDQVFQAFCPVATTVKPQETGYDLVVILDSSVSQEYFDWMTTFTKNLADTVSIDNDEFRVGLLRYSTDSNVQFNLKDYQSSGDVQNAVDQVGYKGGITNTAQAIDTARTQMFRPDQGDRDYARNFILLITGQDKSLSTNDAWRAAERAETDGIQLYVMGLNINDREELDETSSHPLSTYQYLTRSERELAEVPPQIYADLLGMAKNPPPMRPRPVKPDVDIKPYRSTVRYGGPVTIECTVKSGIPVKEVTWYRVQGDSRTPVVVDGRKYSGSTVRVPSLTINNADFQDEGTYVCTAENAAGVGSSPNGDIDVTGAVPAVTVPKREYTGDMGTEVTLECDVVANPPESNVYWRRMDRGEMTDVDTRSSRYSRVSPSSPSLTIRNLDTSDTGMYQCFADNPVGTGQSQQTSLRVLLPITIPATAKPCGQAKVDIVIILDSSTSVGDDNYQKMKNFCKDFLKNADLDSGNIRAGIVSYSTGVHIEFQMNDYGTSQDIMDAIDAIPYRYGSTNTADGLKTMRSQMFTAANGDRDGVPNVVLILTDGVSNINSRRTIPEAEQARSEGIHIYAVGIGLTDTRELDAMASEPASENSFNVQSFDELAVLSDQVFQAFCPGATTAAPLPKGYDIVIAMDSSVQQDQFDGWMKTYAKRFVNQISVDDDEYRLGLVRFDSDADVQFDLKDYRTKQDVLNAVDNVQYKPGGTTNVAGAFDTVRQRMFKNAKGDRDFARNYILLLTGNERSDDTNGAWAAAERAEDDGIGIYVVGVGINDRTELDETSSHPLNTFQYVVGDERELKLIWMFLKIKIEDALQKI